MGETEITRGREVRLVLGPDSYVRKFKSRLLARILKVRNNEIKICRPWRRDLTGFGVGYGYTSTSTPVPYSGVVNGSVALVS